MGWFVRSAVIWVAFPVVLSPAAEAASFDCAKANAPMEILICADVELGDLDSALSAEWKSAFARQPDQRPSLLANQRAWLRARDQRCAVGDRAPGAADCLRLMYAERIAELKRSRPASAASLDGSWRAIHPCPPDRKACEGRSDLFSLELWSRGPRLCGTHLATGHLGNQVDENDGDLPSIVGTIEGPTATIAFKSSWGGAGHAEVTRIGKYLYWRVLDHDDARNWFPDEAVLTENPKPEQNQRAKSCDATRPEAVGG